MNRFAGEALVEFGLDQRGVDFVPEQLGDAFPDDFLPWFAPELDMAVVDVAIDVVGVHVGEKIVGRVDNLLDDLDGFYSKLPAHEPLRYFR
jgi:hypothetical protein